MESFFQTLIATIAVGSLYALVALGYTLVYGVLKFINFAHSDIFVLGAWTSFTTATIIISQGGLDPEHAPVWLGMIVLLSAIGVCALTGYIIERFAYRPLRKAPRLNVLITAIGVSLLLQNVGQLRGFAVATEGNQATATVPFGPSPKSMPALLPNRVLNESVVGSGTLKGGSRRGTVILDQPIELSGERVYRIEVTRKVAPAEGSGGAERTIVESLTLAAEPGKHEAGVEFGTQPRRDPKDLNGASYRLLRSPLVPILLVDVLIVSASLVLMVGLQVLVFKTKMGAGMRALSYNVETASLMGVNVNFIISITFILGTALAAAAAFLYAAKYPGLNQTAHGTWVLLGLKAFVAAVVGGIGNVRGAVLGGFLIAGIEFFGRLYIDPRLSDVYVFGLLILVLLVRPNGLLGKAVREKV